MQYPQYSFPRSQSARVPNEGYSVLQNNSHASDSPIGSQSKSQGAADVSRKSQKVYQGQTHNFSDQPATTWQWRSQAQNSKPAIPIQEAPRVEQIPTSGPSFAPPANLGQLQRVAPPQAQHHYSSDIYKSPIDRPYVGKTRKPIEQLNDSSAVSYTHLTLPTTPYV